jgi:hypothetical protein
MWAEKYRKNNGILDHPTKVIKIVKTPSPADIGRAAVGVGTSTFSTGHFLQQQGGSIHRSVDPSPAGRVVARQTVGRGYRGAAGNGVASKCASIA